MDMRQRILVLGMVAAQALAACGGSAATPNAVGTELPSTAATASATSAPTESGAPAYDQAAWAQLVPSDSATVTYVSGGVELTTRFVASDDTLGEPHSMLEYLGDNGGNPVGVRIWLDVSNPWHLVVFGINAYQNSGTLDEPTISYRYSEPVDVPVDLPVGEARSLDFQATESISGVGSSDGDTTINYTLLEADASVTVPYGTVTGCYHLEIEATGAGFKVELWLKPGIGLVKASEIAGVQDIELAAVGR
jgi:hypothetical protein